MNPLELPPNMTPKITVNENGCWVWTGAKTGMGYGSVSVDGHIHNAHRIAYVLLIGEPEQGLVLDHLCRVRNCVNPEHLEAVTQAVNVRRSSRTNKDRCRNGHDWTPENWYWRTDGRKQCHKCMMINYRRRNARVSAERAS